MNKLGTYHCISPKRIQNVTYRRVTAGFRAILYYNITISINYLHVHVYTEKSSANFKRRLGILF